MPPSPEQEIRELRSVFWSDRDPDGRAFVSLADAYRRGGDLDQALELLEDGLDRHPGFASAHVVAAWVHRDRGANDDAEAAFRAVLALDEENGEALRGLGELAATRGLEDEALDWLGRLAVLEPGNEDLALRIEEIEWARTALASGSSLEPDDAGAPDVAEAEPEPVGTARVDDDPSIDVEPLDEPLAEPSPSDGAGLPEPSAQDADGIADLEGLEGLSLAEEAEPPAPTVPDERSDADAPWEVEGVEVGLDEPEPAEPWGIGELEGFDGFDEPAPLRAGSPVEEPGEEAAEAPMAMHVDEGAVDDEVEPEPGGEVVYTRTMAELYARQGLHDRALRVYEHLLEGAPEDDELRARVRDLTVSMASAPAEASEAPEALPGSEREPFLAAPPPAEPAVSEEDARRADEELEALARDWSEGPAAADELSTPFAWSADEHEEEDPASAAAPVGDYFRRLLAWQPGADAASEPPLEIAEAEEQVVDVADLAPAADLDEPVVDVADLAPTAEAEEPGLDVAELAPTVEPDEPVIDVADLAPAPDVEEPVLDIADLAPAPEVDEPVVDIADLAPAAAADDPVVDVGELAPTESEDARDRDEGDEDGPDDAFTRWLNQLR